MCCRSALAAPALTLKIDEQRSCSPSSMEEPTLLSALDLPNHAFDCLSRLLIPTQLFVSSESIDPNDADEDQLSNKSVAGCCFRINAVEMYISL